MTKIKDQAMGKQEWQQEQDRQTGEWSGRKRNRDTETHRESTQAFQIQLPENYYIINFCFKYFAIVFYIVYYMTNFTGLKAAFYFIVGFFFFWRGSGPHRSTQDLTAGSAFQGHS